MRSRRHVLVAIAALVAGSAVSLGVSAGSARATGVSSVPRPDHIVIVIDENHAEQNILGNVDAPYINSLAASGANMTQFFAETHPSQPNYIALFSGATQGVVDDSCPQTSSVANLGSELLASGAGFAGYSETMPSPGYTGCVSGKYARKHNPWVNFTNIPASANQPFTAFPTDYSTLPAVSFVIPNLDNDMHDGTIAQGDSWLQNNMSGYIAWAKTHNSLFVLTFDEDDGSEANQIPTIVTGAGVTTGSYPESVNHYNLLRTIEDAYGLAPVGASATAPPILDIWTPPTGNQPPQAAFTTSCVQLTCSFDASASTDADGSIASYAWNFGDAASATGVTTTHTYAGAGSNTVTLTVTDAAGATASITHVATPTAPAGAPFVSDSFNRTTRSGLGNADLGGGWSTVGTAANFSVNPGQASLLLAKSGSQLEAFVGPARTDADVAATIGVDHALTGGPVYSSVWARRTGTSAGYVAKSLLNADGTVTLMVSRLVSGAETVLAGPVKIAGLTYLSGARVSIRVQAFGTSPTTVRARVWASTAIEPTTWQVSAADATPALQLAGTVGLVEYLSSAATNAPATIGVYSFVAKPSAATPPANQPPVAAFTSTCAQLTCTFNAGGSSDRDGTVAAYSWNFGDGATGSAVAPAHAFVSAGTFTVTLTVTDNQGATGAVAHQVVATAPPLSQPPVAAFTFACSQLACTFDGTSSSDDEGVTAYNWDFGDGGTAVTATASRTFAAAGSYQVALTVSDEDGQTSTAIHAVAVPSSPVGTSFAADVFARTVTSGWGTADRGGAWTLVGGTAKASVIPGAGRLALGKANQVEAYLPAVSQTDADVTVDFSMDTAPVGGAMYVTVTGRRVSSGNSYAAKVLVNPGGAVNLRLTRMVAGTETAIAGPVTLAGITYVAGQSLSVRLQVTGTGPTALRARAWRTTATEPSTWQVSATDSTAALQAPGSVAVIGYLSSAATSGTTTLSFTGFAARPTTG